MYMLTCLWLSSNIEKTIAIVFGKIYDLAAASCWGAIGFSNLLKLFFVVNQK